MPRVAPDLWKPKGVDELEPAALTVVRSTENALVIAGPGAGKTELLAQRACYLLETGVCPSPKRILAISFKRDAAANLAKRVEKRCGELSARFDSLTLDAFGKSLVDRFGSALPPEWRPKAGYDVMVKFPTIREMREWFLSVPVPPEYQQPDFRGMKDSVLKKNFELCTFGVQLPYADGVCHPLVRHYGLKWWKEQLDKAPNAPSLMFAMLNRLAAYLLRSNPTLLEFLRSTYSHVFLDEFQDTTGSQYDLIHAAFLNSRSVLTAVGDLKQRIMVWAGAMENAFDVFTGDFAAKPFHLIRNYRSQPELVRVQRVIAEAIEAGTPKVESARKNPTAGVCYVAEFSTPEDEADYLSQVIANAIQNDGLKPRDFCVLARQQAGKIVSILQAKLREKGIRLRDESELQDLLVEPAVEIAVAVLRLVTRRRDPEAWEVLIERTALLSGFDQGEDARALQDEVSLLINKVRSLIASDDVPIENLPAAIIDRIGVKKLKAAYRQYSSDKFMKERLTLLGKFLVATGQTSLASAVDELIGSEIIPAMTVHKSKGLEFHTVIFLGLEDSQLWNFAQQSDEEKRGFFVALSRAITRVIFTYSEVRDGRRGRETQSKTRINDLYTLLQQAGVETRDLRRKS